MTNDRKNASLLCASLWIIVLAGYFLASLFGSRSGASYLGQDFLNRISYSVYLNPGHVLLSILMLLCLAYLCIRPIEKVRRAVSLIFLARVVFSALHVACWYQLHRSAHIPLSDGSALIFGSDELLALMKMELVANPAYVPILVYLGMSYRKSAKTLGVAEVDPKSTTVKAENGEKSGRGKSVTL